MLLVVFPDGETFNTVDGCSIVEVPDNLDIEGIEDCLRDREDTVIIDNLAELVTLALW